MTAVEVQDAELGLIEKAKRVLPGGNIRQFSGRRRDPRGPRRASLGRERQGIRRFPAGLRPDAGRPRPS